ncbi:MAG: isochorismatase family protein [Cyclobacteriaceae bacterium]
MFSRREFIEKNTVTGLGAALSLGLTEPLFHQPAPKYLSVKPRYHRWHVDPGEEWLETNTGYDTLDWSIPLSQTALVLVDVWQRHYLKDTEARTEEIIQNRLVRLIDKCRQSGLEVIHAPSASVAEKHPNWVKLGREGKVDQQEENWPNEQFRNLSGPFSQYQRPHEPREAERRSMPELTFHPLVQPEGNEAVVASGEELHRYCKQEKKLFLFFAGFNTNACILVRDYGTIQMRNRGYQVILVRDCTTGMETPETQPMLAQTKNAILMLEMFGHYSVSSREMMVG